MKVDVEMLSRAPLFRDLPDMARGGRGGLVTGQNNYAFHNFEDLLNIVNDLTNDTSLVLNEIGLLVSLTPPSPRCKQIFNSYAPTSTFRGRAAIFC